jgi:phytoene/squalene synthetase
LTNFLQDVSRDLKIERVYLSEDQMQRFEVSEAMLHASTASPEFRRLLKSECDRASEYLHQGLELANHVPRWFAADVRLFAHGGLATLNAIRRVDFDVLSRRPTVSRWRQTAMVVRAAAGLL